MDWNLNAPSEWEWENLAVYSSKEIELKNMQFSSHESQENVAIDNVDFPFSASADSSSKETVKTFGGFDDLPKDFLENGSFSNMVEEASVLSGEAMIGLKLGRHANTSTSSSNSKTPATSSSPSLFPTSSPMIKRSRASYLSSQSPRCQVEGCNLDLSSSKDYHRRHRICANHSKCPKVVVAGLERRFCQQCSRFHDLSEFDDKKRSCRRRLSAHNARRRRPQSEEIQFSSATRLMSSSMCDRRPHMNFLLNRASNIIDSTLPTVNGALQFGSERFMPRNMNHNGMDATPNSILSGDVRHAFSLLSTNTWPSSWSEEHSSFDHFAQSNSISLSQPGMPLELQNTTNTTQLQNFHSFKSPHEFERFYSN